MIWVAPRTVLGHYVEEWQCPVCLAVITPHGSECPHWSATAWKDGVIQFGFDEQRPALALKITERN